MGGSLVKVDIGHGRGWLAPAPAASLRRIDAQLGRLADINEAGRSPEQADENRRKWLAYERYLNGGPWAPKARYALGADQSVHCWGYAADSDDWYNTRAAAVWRDNGWRQTARYPGNKAKDEPWHGEYSESLDNHRFDSTPAGGASTTPVTLPEESEEDDDMPKNSAICTTANDKRISATNPADVYAIVNTGSGYFSPVQGIDGNPGATDLVRAFDVGGPVSWVSKSHYNRIESDCAAVRTGKS